MNVRTLLVVVFRLALAIAVCSLGYLLFIFGHTEVASLERVLTVASIASVSALIAGLLQWVGLPAAPTPAKKKGKK